MFVEYGALVLGNFNLFRCGGAFWLAAGFDRYLTGKTFSLVRGCICRTGFIQGFSLVELIDLFGFAFLSILFCFLGALGIVGGLRVFGIGSEGCQLNLGWRFCLLDWSMCLGQDCLFCLRFE